jgi:hypothetical protein
MSEFLGDRVDVESLDWVIINPDHWIVRLYRRTANNMRMLLDSHPGHPSGPNYSRYNSNWSDQRLMLLKLHSDICRFAGVEVDEPGSPNVVSDDESDDDDWEPAYTPTSTNYSN